MTILVTGGAGFIGGNFVQHLQEIIEEYVVVVDKLGYASNLNYIPDTPQFHFENCDISDENQVKYIFTRFKPRVIFHFAAESHVDNSIKDCKPFIESNIIGTINLLNAGRMIDIEKFHHISTDEVFGSISEGSFTEESLYDPKNPKSNIVPDVFWLKYPIICLIAFLYVIYYIFIGIPLKKLQKKKDKKSKFTESNI